MLSRPVFLKLIAELVKSMNCEVTERSSANVYVKEGGVYFQLQKA